MLSQLIYFYGFRLARRNLRASRASVQLLEFNIAIGMVHKRPCGFRGFWICIYRPESTLANRKRVVIFPMSTFNDYVIHVKPKEIDDIAIGGLTSEIRQSRALPVSAGLSRPTQKVHVKFREYIHVAFRYNSNSSAGSADRDKIVVRRSRGRHELFLRTLRNASAYPNPHELSLLP